MADLDADCTLTIDFEHGRELVGGRGSKFTVLEFNANCSEVHGF